MRKNNSMFAAVFAIFVADAVAAFATDVGIVLYIIPPSNFYPIMNI